MIRQLRETFWVLLAAALAYAVVLPRFYVGYFSDDARDILAAHSLLSGRYLNWLLPGHPPTNFPLPGFPLVLMPVTLFFFNHPAWLRGVPYVLTLICIPLLNRLFMPWLNKRSRICLLVLFAFNPMTVVASGRVMADACFMVAVLAAFVMFQSASEKSSRRALACAALLSGFAAIVRPEGILLLPALAIPLFYRREHKRAVGFFLLAAAPLLGVWIRNEIVTGAISGYNAIWRASLPLLAGHYRPFLKNLMVETAAFCVGLVSGVEFNELFVPGWVWIWTGIVCFFLGRGFCALLRLSLRETDVLVAFMLYAVGFFMLHAVWLALDLHYLWPLLPPALFLGIKGFESSGRGWLRKIGVVLLSVLVSYAYQYAVAIHETKHEPLLRQFPQDTLRWITQTLPPGSFLLTPNAPFISLYTHRFATAYLEAHNEDEFRFRLLERGVTHVLLRPANFLYVQTAAGRNPNEVWAQFPGWAESDPLSFTRLYENPAEASSVYAVRPDPDFMAAFKLYMRARDALNQGQSAVGVSLLKESFSHVRLPGALNAYAAACLLNGEDLRDARKALEEALRRRPGFALAALNLARVCLRTQDRVGARHYFETARAISRTDVNADFLLPVIDREEKEMR